MTDAVDPAETEHVVEGLVDELTPGTSVQGRRAVTSQAWFSFITTPSGPA